METNEVKLLADHMGHNLNIHTDVYALQTSIIEKSKVAKILLAVQSGKLQKMDEVTELSNFETPAVTDILDDGK